MAQIIRFESRVGEDGVLTLRVPLAPSDANADVIVTIQPKAPPSESANGLGWPLEYFDETYGCLANNPLTIPDDPQPTLIHRYATEANNFE